MGSGHTKVFNDDKKSAGKKEIQLLHHKHKTSHNDNLPDINNVYLEKCDSYTKRVLSIAKFYQEYDHTPTRPSHVANMTTKNRNHRKNSTTEMMGVTFLKSSLDTQEESVTQLLESLREDQLLTLNQENLSDPSHFFGDSVAATMALDDLFSQSTRVFPRLSTNSMEWEKNESTGTDFTDFIFRTFAQYFLRDIQTVQAKSPYLLPDDAVYAIDVSQYNQYPLRQGFAKYGAIAYFDPSYRPCGIWHCESQKMVFPGEPSYQHVSLVFRSSLMIEAVIYYNLLYLHCLISNEISVASEKHLSTSHPIRRLLRPHTFGSSRMNYTSFTTLAPYGSLLSRLTGFTEESWEAMLRNNMNRMRYEPFSKAFQQTGLPEDLRQTLPLYQDGMDYWNLTARYVGRYSEVIYPEDKLLGEDKELQAFWEEIMTNSPSNSSYSSDAGGEGRGEGEAGSGGGAFTRETLVEYLTNFIFTVTGLSQVFGTIHDCPVLYFPLKVFEGKEESDVQTCLLQTSYLAITSGKMPKLLNNWWAGNVFREMSLSSCNRTLSETDLLELENNHSEWQESLRLLSHDIDQRNILDRSYPFNAMNPKQMECSISL